MHIVCVRGRAYKEMGKRPGRLKEACRALYNFAEYPVKKKNASTMMPRTIR